MRSAVYKWILVVAAAAALVLVVIKDRGTVPVNEFQSLLPRDAEEITSITIKGTGTTLEFRKSGSQWEMEDEVLNQKSVENLLAAAAGLSMKSIQPLSVVEKFSSPGEIVFYRGRRESGRFKFAATSSGFYIFSEGAETIYGAEISGYEKLPPEQVFSLEREHYREHLLLDLIPDEIRSVRIEPLSGTSFIAVQDSLKNITVFDLDTDRDITNTFSEPKMRLLFSCFNAIDYNFVVGEGEFEPESLQNGPISTIGVTSFEGESATMHIFPWIKPGTERPDIFQAIVLFNDRPDYLSVSYLKLDLLMRGAEKYSEGAGEGLNGN